ncbi:MAG: chemotaxis protein CheR, partial [Vallitaleaceae bacterium]|nr:chemotaxis protein CheR [Vallitaleaceae bacterium]
HWDTKILATDISNNVLEIAKRGMYPTEKLAPLPIYWRQMYVKKVDKEYSRIVDRIRNEVIYRNFNLMEPVFPFKKKFHVIFCRNVMIYFNQATKDELIEKFYEHLEDGGYLFIGHSESVNRNKSRFKYICPAVYQK